MSYPISRIATIINAKNFSLQKEDEIEYLLTDSRKLIQPANSLFFALKGKHDGHTFIAGLYGQGVRNFVISSPVNHDSYASANFLLVNDTLQALQALAAAHRQQFAYPVIGITGSNGKTIVKEWLFQLLSSDYTIVRSPKSYNSQIGVPLSVWLMGEEHDLAIFEAGISQPGEMGKLENMIKPDIGILTNIGSAHDEGFSSREEKVTEKLKLFTHSSALIYSPDYVPGLSGNSCFTWSVKQDARLHLLSVRHSVNHSFIRAQVNGQEAEISIPFTDKASVENAVTCWCVMLHLGYDQTVIGERMNNLAPIAMRLELKQGINHCSIINDSYSADLSSLAIALDFLTQQQQHSKKTIILSDILQSGKDEAQLYESVAGMVRNKGISRIIGIGKSISAHAKSFAGEKVFFPSTEEFLNHFSSVDFHNETILLKGARLFEFERINRLLEEKVHETVLEVNLNAMVHNLNFYRSKLKPETKIMAMVKAFSYGSGSFEVANLLQYHKVDYLAVAYADEGVALRQAGITMPVMVMSPETTSFDSIIEQELEPEIYSFRILESFIEKLQSKDMTHYPVHLKLDTGMRRLGFEEQDLPRLVTLLKSTSQVKVQSVFSHLAGSEEQVHDDFSEKQIAAFGTMSKQIELACGYRITKHIANTAAILRFPEAQLDMVRLGIGIYGIDSTGKYTSHLQHVGTLKTTISQIKKVAKGETVGYNRKGIATQHITIATVKIGYADGFNRNFSNGKGYMVVKGHSAPVVGNVCMDMCMIDITGIDVQEGDEVIVFGEKPTISELAERSETIAYEVLTAISQRVKRIYHYE